MVVGWGETQGLSRGGGVGQGSPASRRRASERGCVGVQWGCLSRSGASHHRVPWLPTGRGGDSLGGDNTAESYFGRGYRNGCLS